jgi:hypothetical protein
VAPQPFENALVDIAHAAAVLFHEGCMPVGVTISYADGDSWRAGVGHDSVTPADWESALVETLRAAAARQRRHPPILITVWFSDGSSLQRSLLAGESPAARSPDDISQCKQDIVGVLYEKKQRLTTSRILQELEARQLLWGESTVKRVLAEMVRKQELTNRSGVRPRGYGLPGWE